MAGFDKRVASYEEALAGLEDGMTVLSGGFGLCGIPENLIAEIDQFDSALDQLRDALVADDRDKLEEMFRLSTQRRAAFDKKDS